MVGGDTGAAAVLIDFGTAIDFQAFQAPTGAPRAGTDRAYAKCGTKEYAAPEQISPDPEIGYTAAVDVWSAGMHTSTHVLLQFSSWCMDTYMQAVVRMCVWEWT